MKKTIAAVTAGLLLVAGQAVAQNNTASARVGDRVGANVAESSEFAGIPLPIMIIGGIVGILVLTEVFDDSDSD